MQRIFLVLFALLPLFAAAEEAPSPAGNERQAQLKQAFDGAMTCSALTAIKADKHEGNEHELWANRSFAFGMLAVRFYTDLTERGLSNDELNNALNQYADALITMTDEEIAPFETGCGNKYPDMDQLCVDNDCVFPNAAASDLQNGEVESAE
ncbi:MAG: hypothetical protein WD928_03990 [Gammaproteobacteria bacterium]